MASRKIPEINASSMADIAFLLLVFFLVTTTIQTDAGVNTVLPPFVPPDLTFKENERNICAIQINSNDQIQMRGREVTNPEEISEYVYRFMSNKGAKSDMSDSPDRAIVSLLNDNGTSYKTYLEVYDQVKMACDQFRNEVAQGRFGKLYKDLNDDQQREVRKEAPCKISEADPTDFGKTDE